MWVCMNVGFNIRNQAGYQFVCVCVFPGGVYMGVGWGRCSSVGLCKKKVSMSVSDNKYKYLLWDAFPVYVCMYKREGDPGGSQPSPGSSELLDGPVPGHLGSSRALWCAGEKWKC